MRIYSKYDDPLNKRLSIGWSANSVPYYDERWMGHGTPMGGSGGGPQGWPRGDLDSPSSTLLIPFLWYLNFVLLDPLTRFGWGAFVTDRNRYLIRPSSRQVSGEILHRL
ncbi:unnamed protein product, partial [Nesidiocoris tenuis]